jgi:hypothetical protein
MLRLQILEPNKRQASGPSRAKWTWLPPQMLEWRISAGAPLKTMGIKPTAGFEGSQELSAATN